MSPHYRNSLLSFHLRLATALLLMASSQHMMAQATGHFGKKLIVNVALINGRYIPFNSFEAEYTVGRQTSLFASFTKFSYGRSEKGIKSFTGSIESRGGDAKYKEYSTLKNGSTTGSYFGIGLRHYFNRIIPAPYGWYVSFFVGTGKATYSDYLVSYSYKEKLSNTDRDGIARPDSKLLNGDSRIFVAELPSFGYQKIFKRLITLDFRCGLLTQYTKLPDDLVNAIENNYYLRSNAVAYGAGRFSFGLNANLRIGFLIF
jgi:hypothetical protein